MSFMSTLFKNTGLFLTVIIFMSITPLCFAKPQTLEEIENLWKNGEQENYLKSAHEHIVKGIELCQTQPDNTPPLLDEIKSFFAKEHFASQKLAVVALTEKVDILKRVASLFASKQPSPYRPYVDRAVLVASNVLQTIKKNKIEDFVPKIVYLNVPLPKGVYGAAGMNPDAIKDPEQKKKYKAAIEENRSNAETNEYQSALVESEAKVERSIVVLKQIR
ncbi:MAG: hypothetical protein PHV34_19685 [Verrucomicrobiae bacterium]|nr:hypothetical protein [Verrucomicrobiae bacterium]